METVGTDAFLSLTLKAFAGLSALVGTRVYGGGMAPQEATFPYVIFGLNSNSDIRVIGTDSGPLANNHTYFVKAVTDEGRDETIAARIARQAHLAVEGKRGVIAVETVNYRVNGITRLSIIKYYEDAGAGGWRTHYGGMYQIMTEEG